MTKIDSEGSALPEQGGSVVEVPPEPHASLVGIREDTALSIREVVFRTWRGIRPYQIVRAPEEIITEWKLEVDEFIQAISNYDHSRIAGLMQKRGRLIGDPKKISSLLREETLDEVDIKLLAFGLFVLREKSNWSCIGTTLKVFKGGKIRMESAFEPGTCANCMDLAAILAQLASSYGIKGDIRIDLFSHAYFRTEEGKVSDPLSEAWERGGLFQTKEAYALYRRRLILNELSGH